MFTNCNRSQCWERLSSTEYDLLIVGGGITGAGIALDAVTRGMKVALVEMQDFAAGTSSRSTKLIHGGLRYLKNLEVKLVAEVGRERAIVYENGPHITTPQWMLLPFYKDGTFGKYSTSAGLHLYDWLAQVKKAERKSMLTKEDVLKKEPLIKKKGLIGGGYYVEYRTDDARLTIEALKKANQFGMDALNYAQVTSFIYEQKQIRGANVKDLCTNHTYTIFAKKVVNATGAWVEEVRKFDDQSEMDKKLQLTKGVHIVIDSSRFPLQQAVYFDTKDGRMIFAIPRDGKTYVGTTDTFYEGNKMHPSITEEDCAYLLQNIQYMFPKIQLTEQDIETSWSGVRPLIHKEGKSPSDISRKDEIWLSPSGLMTIAGGKLTGYRKMAEKVVDKIAAQFREEQYKLCGPCCTKQLPLSGGDISPSKYLQFIELNVQKGVNIGLTVEEAQRLCRLYGTNIGRVYEIIQSNAEYISKYRLDKEVFGKLEYSIKYEMIATPVDFFFRRTGALLFDFDWVLRWKESVVQYMFHLFNWNEEQLRKYQTALETEIAYVTCAK
ncbi:MAG: glycerol-3-phosphate dehydrogenase/oxidase [Bacillus sp. (in: firmicutes)]